MIYMGVAKIIERNPMRVQKEKVQRLLDARSRGFGCIIYYIHTLPGKTHNSTLNSRTHNCRTELVKLKKYRGNAIMERPGPNKKDKTKKTGLYKLSCFFSPVFCRIRNYGTKPPHEYCRPTTNQQFQLGNHSTRNQSARLASP